MKKISLDKKIKVIAIVGPTASGKTDYSISLAKEVNGEIISADSRLVYKDFNIGTAKPTTEEMKNIPHYMIDIVEPSINYSAALYKEQANKYIYDITSRGKMPIIVGGTGLYIDILLKNYQLPQFEPNIELRKKLEGYSTEELYTILKNKDKNASNIDTNDRKKIIRAIEIILTLGKPLNKARGINPTNFDIKWIGRNYKRDEVYERINQRVDLMIGKGLINETENLIKKYGRIPNITDTIGYKEILAYLDRTCSLNDAINTLKQNTRRYAKRQLTWFRKNKDIEWNIYPETLRK